MDAELAQIEVLLVDDDPVEYEIIKYKLDNMKPHDVSIDYVSTLDDALGQLSKKNYDIILMDNMLLPHNDFRQTVPEIRKAKYIGPIGVISNDISGGYFQAFGEYGVDFRMAKQEIDARSLRYILSEYTRDNSVPFDEAW